MKNITKIIARNICIGLLTILIVSAIVFWVFEIIPGDFYELEYIKDPKILANIRDRYGLDKPVFYRFWLMLKSLVKLDFGYSYVYTGVSVNDVILRHFPLSAMVGIMSLFLSALLGIILGICCSIWGKKITKFTLLPTFFVLVSVPTFVLASLIQYVLCVRLNLFDVFYSGEFSDYVLPSLLLSVYPTVFIARLLSSNITSVKNKDYVQAASLRGVNKRVIICEYILKNSLTPIISYLGQLSANLLTGSFAVETIFNIPGLGRYYINSIENRDYPMVIGLTVFYACILVLTTLIANVFNNINNHKGSVESV